ncbi:TetR/AcrR family transcriptional regulator [Kibdelosporangium philippinense]|uniref:TetR/AcrR family transcriptional regulator n=1 Tax=Kibdelosporangium philippinense TaxID=211113 RepID=A0ABS8ZUQ6_9PSEU|nr:TetR family transcriptional regulator [Kibdelosporangium philippinense]MCE7010705.1 TetR/AcrR family transcriptional regulator [Kibdelosporangium philippinense]
MGLRELKMERTRQLIADKAFELFTEHGFDETTVEQIAAAAEVGPRTLYRYFPTKETLIVNFVESQLFSALDRMREQPDDVPVTEAMYALIDSVVLTTAVHESRVLAIYELAGRTESVNAQFSSIWFRWRAAVADEISRRSKRRGGDMAASLAAATVGFVIDVTVHAWVESGGKANMRRLANRALELLRNGEVPVAMPAGRR